MNRFNQFVVFCVLCVMSVAVFAGNRPSTVSASAGFGGYYFASKRHIENSGIGFVGLGYNFTYHWGVDSILGFFTTDSRRDIDNGKQVNATIFAFDALYRFNPYKHVEAYIMAGPGIIGLNPNGNDPNNEGNINAGVGAQYFVDKSLAFRVEGRDFYTITGGKNDLMWDAGMTYLFDLC